jgi:hypothetical protein
MRSINGAYILGSVSSLFLNENAVKKVNKGVFIAAINIFGYLIGKP